MPLTAESTVAGLAEAARHANSVGDFPRAQAVIARALAALTQLDDVDRAQEWRGRLLVTRALTAYGLSGRDAALATLDEARRIGLTRPTRRVLVLVQVQTAVVEIESGGWRSAQNALALSEDDEALLSPVERCSMLINRGVASLNLRNTAGAKVDFAAAIEISGAHHFVIQEFKARHNLGCAAYVEGDLPRALRLLNEARALSVAPTPTGVEIDLAVVLLAAGLVSQARRTLTRALVGVGPGTPCAQIGDLHVYLAQCAALGDDLAEASGHLALAADAFAAQGLRQRARQTRLTARLMSGDPGDANGDVPLRVGDVDADTFGGQRLLQIAADRALRRGELDEVAAICDELGDHEGVGVAATLPTSVLRARLAVAQGDVARARDLATSSWGLFVRHQDSAGSLEMRVGLAVHARRLRDLDLRLALDAGPEATLRVSERWRSVATWVPALTPPRDPTAASLLQRLRLVEQSIGHSGASGAADAKRVRSEVERLQEAISAREWARLRSSEAAPHAEFDLAAAQALARELDACVVSLVVVEGRCHRVVLGDDRCVLDERGPAGRLRELVRRISATQRAAAVAGDDLLRSIIRRSGAGDLRAFDEATLGGLDRFLNRCSRVVVVPPGIASGVPWALLPTLAARPVVLSPSISDWVRRTRHPSQSLRHNVRAAVIAGPGLPRAVEEATRVAAIWGEQVSGIAPTSAAIDALRDAELVHVAAHGSHRDESPLFSALHLVDGPLYAHELPRPIGAELVVLAACDVGRTGADRDEELLGLSHALLALGARSVIASAAPVRDDAATAAMVLMHQELQRGAWASQALADAQQVVTEAGSFSVIGGDWRR